MSDQLFDYSPEVERNVPGQWRLSIVQLFNWGTIDGACRIDVPRKGMLITGESGSGKSTILDALSAMMMPDASSQFNAAASGGSSGDSARNRLSYVRGAYAQELDEDSYETRTVFLRPKATKTGIAVSFDNGQGKQWTGVRIFHAKSGTSSSSELTQGFFSFDRFVALGDIMEHVRDGHFIRVVQQAFPDATTSATSKSFHGVLIRKIGIGSEVAAALLHKTLATKNVSSLNRLMRDYMLDEPKTFKSAQTAVEQFRNLKLAHEDVVKARQRIELLAPMRDYQHQRHAAGRELARAEHLLALLDVYGNILKRNKAQKDEEVFAINLARLTAHSETLDQTITTLESDLTRLNADFVQAGGGMIDMIKQQLHTEKERLESILKDRDAFEGFIEDLPITAVPTNSEDFHALMVVARQHESDIRQAIEESDQERTAQEITANSVQEQILSLERELESLQHRENALPTSLVEVRAFMAHDLGIPEHVFPFAAELISVSDPQWRGAAERLLGSFGKNLLVPDEYADRVSTWVNGRRLVDTQGHGVDLFYQRIPQQVPYPEGELHADSILTCIDVKDHPMSAWLNAELLRRFNYVRVNKASELRHHTRALTKEGLIRTKGHHQKRDRRRIDDRSQWILGWTNHDRVDELRSRLLDRRREHAHLAATAKTIKQRLVNLEQTKVRLNRAMEYQWAQLNAEGQRTRCQELETQLGELTSADGNLARLDQRRKEIRHALNEAKSQAKEAVEELGGVKRDLAAAREALRVASAIVEAHTLDVDDEHELAEICRGKYRSVTSRPVEEAIDTGRRVLGATKDSASRTIEKMDKQTMAIQMRYINEWAEYSTNLTESEKDIPDFLDLLTQLESDNLPSFEERFRELLRDQTQKEIASLSMEINNYYRSVKRRIDPVNESLAQTPYNQERNTYLRIEPRHAKTPATQEFLKDLKGITSGQFSQAEESPQDAEVRFTRIEKLMNKLSSQEREMVNWRLEVLDTRRHVSFVAHEENPEGTYKDVYDTSAGRSGGQSQKLVTFALAAALRFQLAAPGQRMPRYGTIMLDEAFDKTDSQFARASLEIFRSFGFHLVLASPMKMNQTVEPYVGGVVQTRLDLTNRTQLAFATYDNVETSHISAEGVRERSEESLLGSASEVPT